MREGSTGRLLKTSMGTGGTWFRSEKGAHLFLKRGPLISGWVGELGILTVEPGSLGSNRTQTCPLLPTWPQATLLSLSVPQFPHH